MSRTVYLNGAYVPEEDAKISIFDRGFLMADGVYEVTSVIDGKLIDFDGHTARLDRSLRELDMENPISRDDLLLYLKIPYNSKNNQGRNVRGILNIYHHFHQQSLMPHGWSDKQVWHFPDMHKQG